jgi:hypothetical protein
LKAWIKAAFFNTRAKKPFFDIRIAKTRYFSRFARIPKKTAFLITRSAKTRDLFAHVLQITLGLLCAWRGK